MRQLLLALKGNFKSKNFTIVGRAIPSKEINQEKKQRSDAKYEAKKIKSDSSRSNREKANITIVKLFCK